MTTIERISTETQKLRQPALLRRAGDIALVSAAFAIILATTLAGVGGL